MIMKYFGTTTVLTMIVSITSDAFVTGSGWMAMLTSNSNTNILDLVADTKGFLYFVAKVDSSSPATFFDPAKRPASQIQIPTGVAAITGKISTNGSLIWAASVDLRGDQVINVISVNTKGSIFIAGKVNVNPFVFRGKITTTFPGYGTLSQALVIAKISPDGEFQSLTQLGGNDNDYFSDLVCDSKDNVIATGMYQNPTLSVYSIDNRFDVFHAASNNNLNRKGFLLKFGAAGNLIWASNSYGTGIAASIITNVRVDSECNMILSLIASSNAFLNATDQIISLSNQGDEDVYHVKLRESGLYCWMVRFTGIGIQGSAEHVVSSQDELLVGYYSTDSGALINRDGRAVKIIDCQGYCGVLVKWSLNGSYIWHTLIDGSQDESISSIALSLDGTIYVTGMLGTRTNFYGKDEKVFKTIGDGFAPTQYFTKYSDDGFPRWIALETFSWGLFPSTRKIAVDSFGVYNSGFFATYLQVADASGVVFRIEEKTESAQFAYLVKRNHDGLFSSRVASTSNNSFFFKKKSDTVNVVLAASTSESRIPKNAVQPPSINSSLFIALIAGLGAGLGLLLCVAGMMFWRRKNTISKLPLHPTESRVVLFEPNMSVSEMTGTMNRHTNIPNTEFSTMIVTQHELSVPAYLEMEYGTDFIQGDFIAKGGGGALYFCEPLDTSLTTHKERLVLKRVARDFSTMNPRLRVGFLQELSLAHKFRDAKYFVRIH